MIIRYFEFISFFFDETKKIDLNLTRNKTIFNTFLKQYESGSGMANQVDPNTRD